jgi:DNA repair protein SbcC/Rad50
VRIESVTSVAFGPLTGASLEFAPQLTVVYGPNEAGKSSWHAAIYAALCGMRRGKGQLAADRDFAERRRPWSGGGWEVHAIVRLDDGRRVELRRNLSDLADCSARDADLGRDVSSEILNEGTPDAAKWLGLNRQSFLSVACVRQAEVQGIVDGAESLQGELQRAAASAARDATAADAIARIEKFQSEQVGLDRANSTKPLQRAKVRLEAANEALATARRKHGEWLAVESQALDLRRKADEEERELRMLRASRAHKEAGSWRARLDRAQALAATYPGGQPALLSDDEALAAEVAAALGLWLSRPEVPVLTGKSSAGIRAEIEALPSIPSGDRVPRAEVVTAIRAHDRAVQALQLHEAHRPSDIHLIDAMGLTADQLRELARIIETPVPTVDSGLEAKYRELQVQLGGVRTSRSHRPLIAGLAVTGVLGGVGLGAFWNPWIGAVLVLSGVAAFVWLVFRSGEAGRSRMVEALRELEAQVLSQRSAAKDAQEKVNTAHAKIVELALPVDGKTLRDIADGLVLAEIHRQTEADWLNSREELGAEAAQAGNAVAQALRDAGIVETTDLAAAFQEYERACQSRADQMARAATRQSRAQQLSDRESAEQAVRDAQTRRSSAEQRILAVLQLCGLDAHDPDMASETLGLWQTERKATLIKFDEATREYAELNALLDGGTLEDLETQTSSHERQAAELTAEFARISEIAVDVDLDQEVSAAEKLAHDSAHKATGAETLVRERAREVPNVPEAEEALDSAKKEFERVTCLSRTLALTLEFLGKAEERVHRDIAPLLAAGLRRWLSNVTQGRYTDARVDPSDLSVQVLGPDNEWRDARQLSHGTAEQIYLLLRVVLAERLATTGETCPLILDDVLVQSDRARKRALLETIALISRGRQVILLTQEEEVLRWAKENVVAPNRVLELPSPAVARTTT